MQIRHIVVTGSSGTIGTCLAEKLLERGFRVTGVDIRKNKWSSAVDRNTVLADLRDKEAALAKLPESADLVVHLAANARVYNLVVNPDLARDNVEMTYTALEFARLRNVPRFILASSREVYGNLPKIPPDEDDVRVRNCESTYTFSKLASEAAAHAYRRCYELDFLIFRFSNVYGMYDDSDRIIPQFIGRAKAGEPLTVYGEDKMLDFTYIDDTVNGILLGIERFAIAKNQTFNIASGRGTTIVEVANLVKEKMRSSSLVVVGENRTGEVVRYIADISLAQKFLGYQPAVSIADGIEKSIAWYGGHT